MLTENKHVKWMTWEVVAVHESLPAWLPAGYSFPALSETFNSAPEETQSFPNILSQLRCDPAIGFSPITTPLQQNTALSPLPHTWTAVNPNSGRCLWNIQLGPPPKAYGQGESVKGNSCQDRSHLHYFQNSKFPSHSLREGNKRDRPWRIVERRMLDLPHLYRFQYVSDCIQKTWMDEENEFSVRDIHIVLLTTLKLHWVRAL